MTDNGLKSCGISPAMISIDNVAQQIVQRNLCRPKVYNCLKQITNLQNKKILDWGCGSGFFIYDAGGEVDAKNYTGVDTDLWGLKRLKGTWKDATVIHYNKYNQQYNNQGEQNPEWCLDKTDKFDVIFSYSVFTHTSFKEFEYIFNRHKEHLNEGGIILHTFIDLYNVTDVQYSIPNNKLDKYLRGEYFPANELYRYDDIVKKEYDEIKCERFDAMFSRHYVKEKLNCEINEYDMLLCSAIYKRED